MPLWLIALCHCLIRLSIPFRYQSLGFEAKNSRRPCSTSAILSKIFSERKCAIDLKRWNSDSAKPGGKPDMVATSLYRIPPASLVFFWEYEARNYHVGITHGFCWLIRGIFLLKVCTFDPIVHSIIQNSSPYPLVQVRSGEHRAYFLFRSFCVLPPVVQVARDLKVGLTFLEFLVPISCCRSEMASWPSTSRRIRAASISLFVLLIWLC